MPQVRTENDLEDESVEALSKSLAANSKLTSLNLQGADCLVNVGEVGGVFLYFRLVAKESNQKRGRDGDRPCSRPELFADLPESCG